MNDSSRNELISTATGTQSSKKGGILKKPSNFFSAEDSNKSKKKSLKKAQVSFKLQTNNLPNRTSSKRTIQHKKQKTISKWSLKLSSLQMQEEFTDYIRQQSRSYALVLVPVIFVTAILAFIGSLIVKKEETRQEVLQMSFLFGLPALIGGVLLAFSFKSVVLVELLTPVMLIIFTLTLLLINTSEICGVPQETMR